MAARTVRQSSLPVPRSTAATPKPFLDVTSFCYQSSHEKLFLFLRFTDRSMGSEDLKPQPSASFRAGWPEDHQGSDYPPAGLFLTVVQPHQGSPQKLETAWEWQRIKNGIVTGVVPSVGICHHSFLGVSKALRLSDNFSIKWQPASFNHTNIQTAKQIYLVKHYISCPFESSPGPMTKFWATRNTQKFLDELSKEVP